jgi:catechol 2,3-dioxygenase-like lactoylglutathione lyase family enzyme
MRLNHVTLIVSEFERSKRFYRSLGLVQIVDSPPRYARFRCQDGDATLSIEVTGEAPTDGVQLFFECDALDETVTSLKAKGIVFDQNPTDMPYLWREARLRDPDGHDLRLLLRGRLPPQPSLEAHGARRDLANRTPAQGWTPWSVGDVRSSPDVQT